MDWFSRKPYIALIVSMVLVGLIPLFLSTFFYWRTSAILNEQMDEILESSQKVCWQNLDEYINKLNKTVIDISTGIRFKTMPDSEELTSEDRMDIFELRNELSHAIGSGVEGLEDIYIYSTGARYAISRSAMYDSEMLYEKYFWSYGVKKHTFLYINRKNYTGSLIRMNGIDSPLMYCYSVKPISSEGVPDKQIFCIIDDTYLNMLIENSVSIEGIYFVLDQNEEALLMSNNTEIDVDVDENDMKAVAGSNEKEIIIDGERMYVYTLTLGGGYVVCGLIHNDYVQERLSGFRLFFWISICLSVIWVALAAYLFSRKNYKPISGLQEYLRKNFNGEVGGSDGLAAINEMVHGLLLEKAEADQRIVHYRREMQTINLSHMLQGRVTDFFRGQPDTQWADELPYAVLCIYMDKEDDKTYSYHISIAQSACNSVLEEDYLWEITIIDECLVIVIGSVSGDDNIESAIERSNQLVSKLRDLTDCPVYGSISNIHKTMDQMQVAYQEASLAMDYGYVLGGRNLSRYDECKLKTTLFLRDWTHLDKQLRFAFMVGRMHVDEALEYLDNLFPEVFLSGILPGSEISGLHLSSLKYQFLHEADSLFEKQLIGDEEWKESITRIIYSKDHMQLRIVMKSLLMSAKPPFSVTEGADDEIIKIIEYIETNFDDSQLSVETIAAHFNRSGNTLSKYFKRKTGNGVLRYIHTVRTAAAKELLAEHPELNISQVALKVGYTSVLTFNREFKDFFKMTPGEYRETPKI